MSTLENYIDSGSPPAELGDTPVAPNEQQTLPPPNQPDEDSREMDHRPKLERNKVIEVEEIAVHPPAADEQMKDSHDEMKEGQALEASHELSEVPSEKENDTMETMETNVSKGSPLPEKAEDSSEVPQSKTDSAEQAAEDSATSKELPYSTRGRSTDREMSSGEEKFSAIEALEEIGRVKESPPATLGVSFLESLSEEERRTRTRFVPDVEGMHILRKHEIKDDLSLARSLVSSSGITSLKKSKAKSHDVVDGDEEGGTSPSEDGSADVVRVGTKLLELPSRDLVVPSNAFVAPSISSGDDEGNTTTIAALKTENGVKSPLLVDSITAFNPPRPPESVGAKKKHRMLRWERRPEDVEVDLNNYRKTVQRTRQELHKAEAEYNRLETIDAHLRWNFMSHLNLMNEEYIRLNEEISTVQQECVKAADLLTSRTRSRGAGKGSYVMRDVLTVLKTKKAENVESMETDAYPIVENPIAGVGIGGLGPGVLDDWNRESTIVQRELASAWTVPGDKVKTPYGEGVVLEVLPPEMVLDTSTSEDNGEVRNGDKRIKKSRGDDDIREKLPNKNDKQMTKNNYLCNYRNPRVAVKLSFGVGYFGLNSIKPLDNPCLFSDVKLCRRWKGIVATALSVQGTIDTEGMNFNSKDSHQESNRASGGDNKLAHMDVDGTGSQADNPRKEVEDERFLPFGASLLPTATGRGNLLQNISIIDLEKGLEKTLFEGHGVLGMKSNKGITEEFRRWEDEEEEFLTLQASAHQLRNALLRQKRFRLLNEKTNAATSERYNRSAELVAEMRSDLKSLKHRLEEELRELGMDENASEQILSKYYLGQQTPVDVGEVSPLKRSRHTLGRTVGGASMYTEDDRESGDDHDLSGDDLESARPSKKLRPTQ